MREFCRGTAYAATRLVDEGRVGTVLILDCDVHQGDGYDANIDGVAFRHSLVFRAMAAEFSGINPAVRC